MLVKLLKPHRRLHADGAVAADPVVEHLEPVADLRGELDPGPPFAMVEQLGLTSPYSGCLYVPRRRSSTDQMNAA